MFRGYNESIMTTKRPTILIVDDERNTREGLQRALHERYDVMLAEDGQAAQNDSEKIRLSTIHQAKGLEFDAVFVIMLCDGLFPSARSLESDDGEEEERRLFYVALTRARNELYMSYPLIRGGFGNSGNDAMQQPSRFLPEIPKDLVNEWNLR